MQKVLAKSAAKRATMWIVGLGLFMDVLDSNIINTSIPAMSSSLHVDPIDIKVALISYLLSLAMFTPTSGWIADKVGAKRVYLVSFLVFIISSLFCGYAHTLTDLVVARTFQGLGGAYMIAVGRLIITRTFPKHELVKAMNAVITIVSLGVMLGPTVGGVITEHFSWPWIFWVNIPVGLLNIIVAYYYLEDFEKRDTKVFDKKGFVLFGVGLALLCFSLSALSEENLPLKDVAIFFGFSVIFLAGYFFHSNRTPYPLLDFNLFKIRTFLIAVTGNLFSRFSFGGMPFLLPLMQQLALGYRPDVSGLILAPIALGIVVAKQLSYPLLKWFRYRNYLTLNTIALSLAIESYQWIDVDTHQWLPLLNFVFGYFLSSQYTGMNSLAYADIKEEQLSASTPITSTVQVIAQSFGVAVAAILLRIFVYIGPTVQQDLLTISVFHRVFLVLGILTFMSLLIFCRIQPNDGSAMLLKGN